MEPRALCVLGKGHVTELLSQPEAELPQADSLEHRLGRGEVVCRLLTTMEAKAHKLSRPAQHQLTGILF